MNVESLRILASLLYREAEEDPPLATDTRQKEWIARQIETDIQQDSYALLQLRACHSNHQVLHFMQKRYRAEQDRLHNDDTPGDYFDYPPDAYQ